MTIHIYIPVQRRYNGGALSSNHNLHDNAHSVSTSREGTRIALLEYYTQLFNRYYAASHVESFPLSYVQCFILKRIVPRARNRR